VGFSEKVTIAEFGSSSKIGSSAVRIQASPLRSAGNASVARIQATCVFPSHVPSRPAENAWFVFYSKLLI